MGYRKTPRIHTLEFDGELLNGLVVRVKGVSFGKVRRLMRDADGADDSRDQEFMDRIAKSLADAMVSWTLEDEDGVPVEPNLEGIEALEFDEVMEIVGKWLDSITGPSKELGKDSSSGATFPGQPLTMEAL